MDINRETADRVQSALDAAGRTPLMVSVQTGIPRTTLLRRLTGTSPFTIAELDLISGYLGVPVHSLIPPTDNPVSDAGAA